MKQQTHSGSSATQLSALELVESLFSAFAKGDISYILDHLTKDCRWVAPGQGFIPIGGEYIGPDGAARFFQILSQTQDVTLFQPREFFVKGDDVLALGTEESRVIKTGKIARSAWSMLFRTRDGQVYEWEQLFDTAVYAMAHQEGV